jgi:chromosome undetermined scaffold_50, whole genome shotgun sequence
LNSKVENEGIPAKEKRTEYTYSEDGTTTENISEPGIKKTTTRVRKGDVTLTEHINDNGRIADREYHEEGYTEKTTDDNGNPTTNICNLDNKKLVQEKTVRGQKYQATYDGQGNTTGIIVQNKESIADIAKKFGVSTDDLMNVNSDKLQGKTKKYFNVGEEIKIPKELEADDKALQGRKTADEAKADFAKDEQIRAKQRAIAEQKRAAAKERDAKLRKDLGLTNYAGAGRPVTGDYYNGNKKTRSVTLTKIGNATHGRTIAKDNSGKVYVIAHNGVILKDTWVNVSAHRKTVVVGKGRYAVDGSRGDGHGRTNLIDADGNQRVMSHDNKILKNSYVQKSDKSDVVRKDYKTAQAETLNMLTSQLDNAKAAFNEQMKQDGWAGDVADGISVLWGSENRASKVREDIAEYGKTLKELKGCKTEAEFNKKFKEKFGIAYNKNAIANYMLKPSAANFKKAFGSKQSIGERVAKYNESQQQGAAVVKTGAEVAGAIALTAATVATGGAAGVIAAAAVAGATTMAADVIAEETDRMKITGQYKDADGNIVKDNKGVFRDGTDHGEIMKDGLIDGGIAALTLGGSKAFTKAYKVGKAAYSANKTASAAEKGITQVAKQSTKVAEKGLAKVSETTEKGLARVGTQSANATEKGLAKVGESTEKGLARVESQGANATEKGITKVGKSTEKGLARVESQGANATEKGLAKIQPQIQGENTATNAAFNATTKAQGVTISKTEQAIIDTAVDTAVGAGAEYMQTGQVTVEGTAMNMAIGAGGLLGEKLSTKLKGSNLYQKASDKVSNAYNNVKDKFASKGTAATPETGLARTEKLNTSNSSTRAEKTADNAFEQKTARKADSTESRRRAEEAKKTEQAKKAEEAKKAEQAKKTEEAKKAEQAKKAEGAKKAQTQSAEKIQTRMETLNAEIKEGELAKDFKEKYADIFDSNYNIDLNDPKAEAALRSKIRPMILAVHGDRSQGISKDFQQAVAEVFDNLKKKNATGVKSSLAQLNNVLDNRVSTLTRKRAELNNLKAQFGDLNAKKTTAENKAEQPKATNETGKAQNTEQPKAAKEAGKTQNTDKAQTANNTENVKSERKKERKAFENLSDEISDTFGYKTQQILSNLKNGQQMVLDKGNLHYLARNNNGKIEIISKIPMEVNFNIPLSNRTPNGKRNAGIKMSDALTPEQKMVYDSSYKAFMDSKGKKIQHRHSSNITTDNILHGTGYDSLLGILDNGGIAPREITGKKSAAYRDGTIPDTLTPLCTDTWDVRANASIRDYFDAKNSHWNNAGEANFLPNTDHTSSRFIIVMDKKSIDPTIMKNSFEVNQRGKQQSVLFKNGNMSTGHDYPTHRAIPIGAPANSIEKIVVDTRIVNKKAIKAIKKKIAQQGYDIKLYDLNGKEI